MATTTLSPKENMLRLFSGEIPEWIPTYSIFSARLPGIDEDPPNMGIGNPALPMRTVGEDGISRNMWGVPSTAVEAVGGTSLPTPGHFILKDIRDWPNVVKAPDLSDVDWKAVAKQALDNLPFNPQTTSKWYSPGGGYFQILMGLMGFTEGLTAMATERDAVMELFQYFQDFYLPIATEYIEYVDPDVMGMGDDSATERAPFVSPEMFRDMLLPFYDGFARLARNRGIPINFHNCGKSGVLFNDLHRIGISSWEPVQLENDIHEIQRKFGRSLVIGGGWEPRGRLVEADVTDEEIQQSVRDCMDAYAQNGGFMFSSGYTAGSTNDLKTQHWNEVLMKEAHNYGRTFYKK